MKLRELFECCDVLAYLYSDVEFRIENSNIKYYFTGYRVPMYGTIFVEWRMYKIDKGVTGELICDFTNPESVEKIMSRKRVKLDSEGWRLEPICAKDLKIRLNNIQEVFQKIEEDKE